MQLALLTPLRLCCIESHPLRLSSSHLRIMQPLLLLLDSSTHLLWTCYTLVGLVALEVIAVFAYCCSRHSRRFAAAARRFTPPAVSLTQRFQSATASASAASCHTPMSDSVLRASGHPPLHPQSSSQSNGSLNSSSSNSQAEAAAAVEVALSKGE